MEPFLDKGVIRESESVLLRGELRELVDRHGHDVLHALGTIERACLWLHGRSWSDDDIGALLAFAASLASGRRALGTGRISAGWVDGDRQDIGLPGFGLPPWLMGYPLGPDEADG